VEDEDEDEEEEGQDRRPTTEDGCLVLARSRLRSARKTQADVAREATFAVVGCCNNAPCQHPAPPLAQVRTGLPVGGSRKEIDCQS
jgi:hypothetical protein